MKVKCIDNKDQEEQLTIGKVYKVLKKGALGDSYYIYCDNGRTYEMAKKRFVIGD